VTPEVVAQLPAIVVALIAAVVVSFALTPVAIRFAGLVGAIDHPDSERRVHRAPIPRAGGWAIVITFVAVTVVALLIIPESAVFRATDRPRNALAVLLGGVLLAAAIGFIDDCWQIRARWQLIGQVALGLVPAAAGVTIAVVYNPVSSSALSSNLRLADIGAWLPQIVTVLWVVGMLNSINFIDGLDGLSSGIALIAAATLGFWSLTANDWTVALLCAVLVGSLAGFLPWNFHPAKVFTGTTGVLAVGYALAVLSILGTAKYAVALLVLGVPIIDTFWIIIRRVAHGHSPFTPDRGHLHHRLLDLGLTHRGVVLLIYAICATLAALSLLLSTRDQLYTFAGFVVGGGVLLFMLTRRGHSDALEADSYPDDESGPPHDPERIVRYADGQEAASSRTSP
jgi:UDP-GlcNAc:undecaprenyl-phosphate/decaprenyl-phosphate GlcNAc-1-phosphate transferase